MSKSKQKQGHNKNSNHRSSGSVTEKIERSNTGRQHKRRVEQSHEDQRKEERANGTFWSRVNAGRSDDVLAAIRGETGSYAHPGGNLPSMHFNVQKEIFSDGTISVLRVESIQEGHECGGALFDNGTYVPCYYVEKFGVRFQSRREDRLQAATQELIVHYLASIPTKPHKEFVADVSQPPSENLKAMLSEVDGTYIVHCDTGDVTFKVYHLGQKACLKVSDSENLALDVTSVFVPVHCLFRHTLEKVTDDETYSAQLALFVFIRTELGELIESMTKKAPAEKMPTEKPLTSLDLEAITKAKERRVKKAEKKAAKEKADQNQKMVLAHMRKNCVNVMKVVSGNIGYCDLSSSSGDLIVNVYFDAADRKIRIEHISQNHMLVLAGLKVGDTIFASNILQGKVDRANMNDEDFNKRSILMTHIREQMEERGIRFKQKVVA